MGAEYSVYIPAVLTRIFTTTRKTCKSKKEMKIWWSCELPMSGSIGFFDCRWEISSLFIPTPLVSGWEWTTNSDKNISLISYLGWNLQLVIFNMSTAVQWTGVSQIPLSKDSGVSCHFLLQGIFPTQEWNLNFLHLLNWQVDSLHCVTWEPNTTRKP